jgi:type VI secretion system protein
LSTIRLLERLTWLEASTLKISPEEAYVNSVCDHLKGLLNTRRGSVGIDRMYGMFDMANLAGTFSQGMIPAILEDIVKQILWFEPRLRNPKIRQISEEKEVITLKFLLTGDIDIGTNASLVKECKFFLRVNSAGKFSIEPHYEF